MSLTTNSYLTVNYEQNNFTVSQCLWNDGATPNIVSIVSADFLGNKLSNSTVVDDKTTSESKKLSAGVIAAIVIASVSFVILLAVVAFFLMRRRSKSRTSVVPTEHINLTHVDHAEVSDKSLDAQSLQSLPSPAPIYKKIHEDPLHGHFVPAVPRIELLTTANDAPSIHHSVHQLPDHDNRASRDYSTAKKAMRAARTPEIGGESINRFELAGSYPNSIMELDDEASRQGLSPGLSSCGSQRTVNTRTGSPRLPSPMSPLSPWNTFYDDRSDINSPT